MLTSDTATAIASELPGDWEAACRASTPRPMFDLQRADGAVLMLREDWKGRGRAFPSLQIIGQWSPTPAIGLSFTRPPLALARDISRRLLPASERAWAEDAEAVRKQEADLRAREMATGLLAETGLLGTEAGLRWWGPGMEARIMSSGQVALTLDCLDAETAAFLISFLRSKEVGSS